MVWGVFSALYGIVHVFEQARRVFTKYCTACLVEKEWGLEVEGVTWCGVGKAYRSVTKRATRLLSRQFSSLRVVHTILTPPNVSLKSAPAQSRRETTFNRVI